MPAVSSFSMTPRCGSAGAGDASVLGQSSRGVEHVSKFRKSLAFASRWVSGLRPCKISTMSEADDLFSQAYQLHVVEEKHREAIDLCRKALEIEPDNYRALVFLGMLLGDHGSESETAEARNCFMNAIERAKSASDFCTTWPEEAAIHHLGIWEWSQSNYSNAAVFLSIDAFLCKNDQSIRSLRKLLEEVDLPIARDIEMIFKRMMSDYQIVLSQC